MSSRKRRQSVYRGTHLSNAYVLATRRVSRRLAGKDTTFGRIFGRTTEFSAGTSINSRQEGNTDTSAQHDIAKSEVLTVTHSSHYPHSNMEDDHAKNQISNSNDTESSLLQVIKSQNEANNGALKILFDDSIRENSKQLWAEIKSDLGAVIDKKNGNGPSTNAILIQN